MGEGWTLAAFGDGEKSGAGHSKRADHLEDWLQDDLIFQYDRPSQSFLVC